MTLESHVNEVLRKIGRNILLFQEFEYLLKHIVAKGSFSGFMSEIGSNIEKRTILIQKQTMGQLVGQYLETTDPEYQDSSNVPEELKEPFFSFKFQTECDDIYFKTKKDALAKMVSDRNQLVHHLLQIFNPKSLDSCLQVEQLLDKQRENILCEINELRQKVRVLQEGKKMIAEFILSDEGEKFFKPNPLMQSPLLILLRDIAANTTRADGWASITTAGQLVKQQAPEELALLKEKYGYKSLKALLIATEIFDLYEEPTKNGFRTLYRLKAGYELSNA